MSLKIGEYGRTNKGNIFIFAWLEKEPGVLYEDRILVDNGEIFELHYLDKNEKIEKHSKNIMDLIEYNDLVKFKCSKTPNLVKCRLISNNEETEQLFLEAEFCGGWTTIEDKDYMIYDLNYLISKEECNKIEWILTKEKIYNNYTIINN